jgi:hypothetical protein
MLAWTWSAASQMTPGSKVLHGTPRRRIGTSVASMAGHYRDSVQMIAAAWPASTFLSALRSELGRLDSVAVVQA